MAPRSATSFDTSSPSLVLAKSLPFEQTPGEPGREACWILGQARRFADPLAVDLVMGLRPTDEPFLDDEAEPTHATWHVRREDVEDRGLRPALQGAGHQERRVPAITPDSIEAILAEAMTQPAPPARVITFVRLEAKHFRLRLLDAELTEAPVLRVRRGRFEHDVAIVRGEGGAWIDRIPSSLDWPLRLAIQNSDGAVRVKLVMGWSLWQDDGSPEQAAVVEFSRAAVAAGYVVEHADLELRPRL